MGGRGRGGTIVDAYLAGQDFATQRGLLSSDDSDCSAAGIIGDDKARLVVAKDELSREREAL